MRGQVKIYQKKIVAKRRRRALFISLYAALSIGLLASGFSYLSHIDSLAIKEVVVTGNSRSDAEKIEGIVLGETAGNYFGLFSKNNSLLYPKDEVREGVLALPILKDAKISRRGLGAIAVSVVERKEAGQWCSLEGACYLLDEDGFVFAPQSSGAPAATVYRGVLSGDPIGQTYLSPEEFKKISFFIRQLGGLSVDPREVSISETGYMSVTLGDGGKIMLDSKDDLSAVLANIAAVVADKTVAPSFPDFLRDLDYIKIDSGNKAVFKLKGSTTPAQ